MRLSQTTGVLEARYQKRTHACICICMRGETTLMPHYDTTTVKAMVVGRVRGRENEVVTVSTVAFGRPNGAINTVAYKVQGFTRNVPLTTV